MLYKHISARPVEQLDAALNRGIYELVGADEQGICRPRTASKQLSSVATESLANERNRDISTVTVWLCAVALGDNRDSGRD